MTDPIRTDQPLDPIVYSPRTHRAAEAFPCLRRRRKLNDRKLTDAQVREIRQHYHAGAATQAQLASLYDVSQQTISDVVTGTHYRDVTEARVAA